MTQLTLRKAGDLSGPNVITQAFLKAERFLEPGSRSRSCRDLKHERFDVRKILCYGDRRDHTAKT